MQPELVTIKTLSSLIDTPEKTIRDWIYRSRKQPTFDPLPYHRLGGFVRFRLTDVHSWIDRRRIRPNPMVK
jgi:predicted DNA-binding transcriptional regulator AlpA